MSNLTTIVILTDSEDEDTEVCDYTYLDDLQDQEVYMGDTEEEDPSEIEPMEEEEDPSETEPMEEVEPSDGCGEPSDEEPSSPVIPSYIPYHPEVPSHKPYRPHPNGPIMMFTPRKRVNPSLAIPLPTQNPPKHRREDARRWDWLPHTLQEWRDEEGIPRQYEVGESSTAPQVPRLTQEPLLHTVPILVVRAATQERRIHSMTQDMERLSERIEECVVHDSQTFWATQHDHAEHEEELARLRQRMEEYEAQNAALVQRVNELEQGENADHSHA